jgi:hypothetical protein
VKLTPSRNGKGMGCKNRRLVREPVQRVVLRDAFPHIERLCIELVFDDASACNPSPQLHTLYPTAAALFRFSCPCGDCDGEFDLAGPVAALVESSLSCRPAVASSTGQLCCQGVRLRNLVDQRNCVTQLSFRLLVDRAVGAHRSDMVHPEA